MQKRGKERKQMEEVERITEAQEKAEREREEAEHAEIIRRGEEARQEKIAAAKREASQLLSSFREPKQVEAKAKAKSKTEARNEAQQAQTCDRPHGLLKRGTNYVMFKRGKIWTKLKKSNAIFA